MLCSTGSIDKLDYEIEEVIGCLVVIVVLASVAFERLGPIVPGAFWPWREKVAYRLSFISTEISRRRY